MQLSSHTPSLLVVDTPFFYQRMIHPALPSFISTSILFFLSALSISLSPAVDAGLTVLFPFRGQIRPFRCVYTERNNTCPLHSDARRIENLAAVQKRRGRLCKLPPSAPPAISPCLHQQPFYALEGRDMKTAWSMSVHACPCLFWTVTACR